MKCLETPTTVEAFVVDLFVLKEVERAGGQSEAIGRSYSFSRLVKTILYICVCVCVYSARINKPEDGRRRRERTNKKKRKKNLNKINNTKRNKFR